MPDVEHDYCMLGVVDLVQHTPASAEPGTVDAVKFLAEGPADSPGIDEQWTGDELDGRGGDIRR